MTPLARTKGPPDPLPPGSGPSPTRAYHRAHGNVTEHQKSQAELNSQVATVTGNRTSLERKTNQVMNNQTATTTRTCEDFGVRLAKTILQFLKQRGHWGSY